MQSPSHLTTINLHTQRKSVLRAITLCAGKGKTKRVSNLKPFFQSKLLKMIFYSIHWEQREIHVITMLVCVSTVLSMSKYSGIKRQNLWYYILSICSAIPYRSPTIEKEQIMDFNTKAGNLERTMVLKERTPVLYLLAATLAYSAILTPKAAVFRQKTYLLVFREGKGSHETCFLEPQSSLRLSIHYL